MVSADVLIIFCKGGIESETELPKYFSKRRHIKLDVRKLECIF